MNKQTTIILKNEPKYTRTTFDNFAGRVWCYQENYTIENDDRTFKRGYYCYGCKNDLIFKPLDSSNRDNPPFRFHKLLVKTLESKDDDWKTGRKTHTYYAFCCKCSINDKSKVKK
jgi:hypothetical protein